MIKSRHRHSLLLAALFTAFWVVFAILFALDQNNKRSSDLPKIIQRGIIKVCGEEDFFSFYTDKQGFHGFHYELAKAFADKYDLELKYIGETNFNKRLELLKSGKCDILSGPLPVVGELRKSLAYTSPILESYEVLVQRRKDHNNGKKPVRDQLLLKEKKIAFTEHSPNIFRIHNLAAEVSDSIFICEYPGYKSEDLIEAVANGIVDFAVCDKFVASAYLKKYPGIDVQTKVGFTQFQAWAVRPEKNSLLDSLNLFISEYKKSPAFTRLLEKYSNN